MHSDDMLRAALRRLLGGTYERPGGSPDRRREVAARSGCNADSLYQAAAGIRLPSGASRTVGREMRLKLDAAFPGWLDGADGLVVDQRDGDTGQTSLPASPTVREALLAIRARLVAADPETSDKVGEALKLLAKVPDSERAFEQAIGLLEIAGTRK